MKALLVFVVLLVLLTSCQSQPTYTDNGQPGQIKVIVFYDDNKNGIQDSGETGAQANMGISQDISCPPSSQDNITVIQTDADGIAIFNDLKPGKYCVDPIADYLTTTKMTQEVYVSSDAITTVRFGFLRQ